MKKKHKTGWRKLPLKLLLPPVLLALTLLFGYFAASSWEGLWQAVGLFSGDTSFQTIEEFSRIGSMPDGSGPAAIDTFSIWQHLSLWIARFLGMGVVLSTLFVLLFEQLNEPIRRLRVLQWGWLSALWHAVAERCVVPVCRTVLRSSRNTRIRGLAERCLIHSARTLKRDYVLICGLGWKGREIALALLEQKRKVSVIEKVPDKADIETVKLAGGMVFIGDAANAEVLRKAGAKHAREIYVVTSDDEMDCRIAQQLESLLPDPSTPLCLDKNTDFDCGRCNALKAVRVQLAVEGYRARMFLENRPWEAPMHVSCFNMEEVIVRELFRRSIWPRLAVAGRRHMAFCIFGWTPMARELVLHVLRSAHFYRDQQREIVVFCDAPEQHQRLFLEEFPCLNLDNTASPAMQNAVKEVFPVLRFEVLPAANAALLSADFPLYDHIRPGWQNHVFYCIDNGVQSKSVASLLQPRLVWYAKGVNQDGVKTEIHSHVYYNYPEEYGNGCVPFEPWQDNFAAVAVTGPDPFGAYNYFCRPETIALSLSEKHARAVAAFYRAAYPEKGEAETFKKLMALDAKETTKHSHLACYFERLWERSREWERESNRQAAAHISVKLALLGMVMDEEGHIHWAKDGEGNPQDRLHAITACHQDTESDRRIADSPELPALAEMEHRRWCAERLLGGWLPLETDQEKQRWANKQEQGVMKREMRLHVHLMPYDTLPPEVAVKDYVIIGAMALLLQGIPAIVKEALAGKTG